MGVTVGGKGRRIFQLDKSRWIKKLLKEAAILYKNVSGSYDKVTVGKALWKQVIISKIMFARGVLIQSKEDLDKAQKIEYGIYRFLLGVAGYTANEALRGEIGSSLMESRQMEASIQSIKDGLDCKFNIVKKALEIEIKENKGDWIHRINKFLNIVKLTWNDIRTKDRNEIRNIIRKYDTTNWETKMKDKKSLYMYREEKDKMGYEECYSNTFRSELLAKARTNSLQLAEWYGRGAKGKENISCPLCKHPEEDLIHFLIECKHLEAKRNTNLINEAKKNKKTKIMQVRMLLFKLKK